MGALIMAHSDDLGLVLPPKLAPIHVVIVPIYKGDEDLDAIKAVIMPIVKELKSLGIIVKFDDNDAYRPGWKFAEYELKGVPLRMAVGMRDLQNGVIELARRDTLTKETRPIEGIATYIKDLLDEIQVAIYQKALNFRQENMFKVDTWAEFEEKIEQGGFLLCHWDGTSETEEKIKELTKATIRCIPLDAVEEEGVCVYSGKPSNKRVVFARAY